MGNPFAHIELNTDDVGAAKKFYRKLFDWKLEDMPGTSYTMIWVGKGGVPGGMNKKPMPDAPNSWLSYVEVASVKKTVATAEKAGGKVIAPYMSIGDMGAIAVLADPQGAVFGVWEKAAKKAKKKPAKKASKKAAKKTAKKKR